MQNHVKVYKRKEGEEKIRQSLQKYAKVPGKCQESSLKVHRKYQKSTEKLFGMNWGSTAK